MVGFIDIPWYPPWYPPFWSILRLAIPLPFGSQDVSINPCHLVLIGSWASWCQSGWGQLRTAQGSPQNFTGKPHGNYGMSRNKHLPKLLLFWVPFCWTLVIPQKANLLGFNLCRGLVTRSQLTAPNNLGKFWTRRIPKIWMRKVPHSGIHRCNSWWGKHWPPYTQHILCFSPIYNIYSGVKFQL